MKKAGLVSSLRGAQGGYVLSKKPSELSIAEILDALDGPFLAVAGLNGQNPLRPMPNPMPCSRRYGIAYTKPNAMCSRPSRSKN